MSTDTFVCIILIICGVSLTLIIIGEIKGWQGSCKFQSTPLYEGRRCAECREEFPK